MSDYSMALDVGGTFTDVIMVRGDTGELWTAKTPSTPQDSSLGFFNGVDKMLHLAGAAPGDMKFMFHGSTVATNTVLEGKGARTGMMVTEGFKYVLEIGRHDIPRKENLYSWVKPKRPVPPRMIVEVPERVLVDGSVERTLDEGRCREAARRLKAMGVQSVAIVFLHAYANPAHEQRAAAIVREEFPEAHVSISSGILPVFREYERSMTTVLNAYIQPVVGRYIARLEQGLRDKGIRTPLLIMKSNGGVFGPKVAAEQAIHMALSGPAAGVIGACAIGELTGLRNAITIDIGGTSADVCLIKDGRPVITNEGEIGPYPLQTPIVDIHTIGAGGGSIASITPQGSLIVGPNSAGAAPGPACYGQGGEEPTVTDANLVLGRIPPHLLGGEMQLDPDLAAKSIQDKIAQPLGLSLHEAAEGVLKIVNNNMVGALRVVSVEKGYDPRQFALVGFGGAGPMHAGELAALLGTPTVVVPLYPGILCALGLLSTDIQNDYVQTYLQRAGKFDLPGMARIFAALMAEAAEALESEGVPRARHAYQRFADLRYAKQGFELTVDFPGEQVSEASVAALLREFHARHEQLYTFSDPQAAVEIVNLRVKALGRVDKLRLPEIAAVPEGSTPEPVERRQVYFSGRGFVESPVYQRTALLAGHRIAGPAIVDQLDTTTVVFPGQLARVDRYGNFIITAKA
ncbi:MAG: hydantoinase/oxoprolinase family protein [Candidatus Lambdaproteobacteria bacterium]|nr:hydantoinase/oxoprolinase family protein [Candidatus Lambdaproteobacteria bacterium]